MDTREHALELKDTELADTQARTAARFRQNNVCRRCREVIRTPEEALLVEGVEYEPYLIHNTLDCYSSEVEALIDRYLPAEETKAVA
jgi:hypothetical protein